MDIHLRECARLLELPEQEVRRLVRQGVLPAYRLHDKHRIGRVDLLEWGIERPHRISPRLFSNGDGSPDSLSRALEAGSLGPLAPGGWEAALGSAELVPAEVRPILLGRLARSFAVVQEGIAIPHPRAPLVGPVDAPRLVGGYLDPPLPLPGRTGKGVWLAFVLVCPTVRPHLDLLARLAFALHDEALLDLLRDRRTAAAVRERLLAVETAALLTGRHSVVP